MQIQDVSHTAPVAVTFDDNDGKEGAWKKAAEKLEREYKNKKSMNKKILTENVCINSYHKTVK